MKAMKRTLIAISSSSSSSSSSDEQTSSQESEDSASSYGDSVNEISSSTSRDEEDSEDDGDEENEGKDEGSCCSRVIQLLEENSDIQVLTLMECKAYLRRHGLRISGSRAECIQRIKEHWRLKDRNGEVLYPRSTFSINCTGDVCKGDVVLFTQKVYKKFDKVSRSGHPSGKRCVAGKIVKESYGAAKQQHTFTVEVLWSKGVNKLPALFPLLIKGRNLYRMKTFRQRWKDENQRAKVLAEKHKRGAAARSVRETRRTKSAMRKQSTSTTSEGQKRQKKFQNSLPSQSVRPMGGKQQVEESRKPVKQKKRCKQKATLPRTLDMKKSRELHAHTSHPRYPYTDHTFEVGPSSSQPLAFPRYPTHFPLPQNHQNAPNFFSSSGPFSTGGLPDLHPLPASVNPAFTNFDNHRYQSHHSQETGWRNSGSLSGWSTYSERRHHPFRF